MNKLSVAKTRNSSIELLRIICMLIIVASHYCSHGITKAVDSSQIEMTGGVVLSLLNWANLGVDTFFIITGYFMCNKSFSLKKILTIWSAMFMYSVGIYTVASIATHRFNFSVFLKFLTPVVNADYWFASVYILILLLCPFINIVLNRLSKHGFNSILIVLIMIWSVLQMIFPYSLQSGKMSDAILLYCVGAYLRLNKESFIYKKKTSILIFAWCILINVVVSLLNSTTRGSISLVNNLKEYLFLRNSITLIMASSALFVIFSKIKINSKLINSVSTLTFGVYLIHDHDIMRNIIWIKIIKPFEYVNKPYFVLHFIVSVIIVFVLCSVVEFLRQKTIGKLINTILDKNSRRLLAFDSKLFGNIEKQ